MEKSGTFAFLFLLALSSVGCSSGNSESSAPASQPSAPPVTSGPSSAGPSGAIVVYSENDSVLKAVGADGQQPIAIANDATYRGTTADGWVIYQRGDQLLSVRVADGTQRVLDDTPGPKIFRGVFDTNTVVYESKTGAQQSVQIVRADGTGHSVPVAPQSRQVSFRAVTPSGRVIFEACDPTVVNGAMHCTNSRLLSTKLDGTDERLVLSEAPLIHFITADDLLVYDQSTATGTAVSVVKSDGSGNRTLNDADSFFASVLPNGRIVYNRKENGQTDLYSVNADGTSTRALATSSEDEFYAGATPDGRVLFLRGAADQRRLYSVDESTGDIRAMQESGDSMVRAVAPDGTVFVSARFAAEAQDNLYSVRADGTALRVLADSSDMEWFAGLAPDGRVVYMRCAPAPSGPCGSPSAQSDLYSVTTNGTGMATLAASSAFEDAQGITKNNLVVYRRLGENQSDLYSVPTTGGAAQPLANTASDERFLSIIE